MNLELHKRYGDYNKDGYFIIDYDLWDYHAKRPSLYKRKKMFAFLFILIPMFGIVLVDMIFKEMGLQLT